MTWATAGQLMALGITCRRRLGLAGRDARLDWCEARIGRPLDSSAELTRPEAATLLTQLGHAWPRPGRRGPTRREASK
jgi:hypothetical protein